MEIVMATHPRVMISPESKRLRTALSVLRFSSRGLGNCFRSRRGQQSIRSQQTSLLLHCPPTPPLLEAKTPHSWALCNWTQLSSEREGGVFSPCPDSCLVCRCPESWQPPGFVDTFTVALGKTWTLEERGWGCLHMCPGRSGMMTAEQRLCHNAHLTLVDIQHGMGTNCGPSVCTQCFLQSLKFVLIWFHLHKSNWIWDLGGDTLFLKVANLK